MYSLTSANRYYLYQGFVRMNLGIDGLFKIIRLEMKDLSPVSGDIFLFFGKNRQSVKILRWDGDGFLLYYKRLEGGSFELPTFNPHTGNYEISYQVLSFILNGVSLKSVSRTFPNKTLEPSRSYCTSVSFLPSSCSISCSIRIWQ